MRIYGLAAVVVVGVAFAWVQAASTVERDDGASAGQEKTGVKATGPAPRQMILVLRLKPGESKTIEVDRPGGGLRPRGKAGRQVIMVKLLPEGAKSEAVRVEEFDQVPGLKVEWEKDLPAVTFRADAAAKGGTKAEMEVSYTDWFDVAAERTCTARVRVVIEGR